MREGGGLLGEDEEGKKEFLNRPVYSKQSQTAIADFAVKVDAAAHGRERGVFRRGIRIVRPFFDVLETTSRGLCGQVIPSRTSGRGGDGDCVKELWGGEGEREKDCALGLLHYYPTARH